MITIILESGEQQSGFVYQERSLIFLLKDFVETIPATDEITINIFDRSENKFVSFSCAGSNMAHTTQSRVTELCASIKTAIENIYNSGLIEMITR